ncbi:flagellar motor switch protein FliN [Arthrobacter sp. I2-34]|uniref:Flagellar motor switch protein FliN n=1 Tax=Arthrobacter hankyongi TaxID=2904801 RepID=A0ABS9L4Q5_9MICC|nr:flagellar motor switch protein FliN [Arthrobacter hankyongi]MCG2621664.1 flagellar motor switch protein FliN [Arthrobacter hankyongi]
MNSTQTLQAAAADALLGLLPSTSPLYAMAYPDGATLTARVTRAVVSSFVGEVSADVAVMLEDTSALALAAGSESALVSTSDLLRPALEAATAVLGTGVLGETRVDNAAQLFADPAAGVFKLASDDGQAAGWFAIRVRENRAGRFGAGGDVVGKLGRINNVEMALTVEIGRTRMSVRDVLGLEPGAVIELDRSAGAPADVLLNGRLIAHGEVVVVDQDYAVRITKILDVAEGLN